MSYQAQNICVYCGSSEGSNPAYRENAIALGKLMASQNIGLVFGGNNIGLMGIIANTILEAGGHAIGVVPSVLSHEHLRHPNLTELHYVETMHERKAMMASLADAFVALPGGYGTFEELMEVLTWSQLGIHRKPIVLFNIAGYYNPLLNMVAEAQKALFIPETSAKLLLTSESADGVLAQIAAYDANGFVPKYEGLRG